MTQETFYKALQKLNNFDGKGEIFVWLCQIAKNTYLSMLQKRRAGEELPNPSEESLEERLLTKESAFEIHRILHALEEPYKEVFSLRTFGELPFKQIGALFGKTESWARVTYHRARLKIKEELQ